MSVTDATRRFPCLQRQVIAGQLIVPWLACHRGQPSDCGGSEVLDLECECSDGAQEGVGDSDVVGVGGGRGELSDLLFDCHRNCKAGVLGKQAKSKANEARNNSGRGISKRQWAERCAPCQCVGVHASNAAVRQDLQ